MLKRWLLSTFVVVILWPLANSTTRAGGTALASHILVGYWHNFVNDAGAIKLSNVPLSYDVVDVAFADVQTGGTITFTPLSTLYSTNSQFISDINILHNRGQKVLISIGGANAVVQLSSATDVQNFVSSVTSVIKRFGFDGVDLDLEGVSMVLDNGDTDFRSPKTPIIVNLISAITQMLANFPGGIILSAAPETAYVQGGYTTYTGIFGAYLPVIYALRDKFTYIHVQDYNTGSMDGRDGFTYNSGTADFLVAMADMLIAGFKVNAFREQSTIFFPGLGPDKVLIGLPANSNAAGSGFMPFASVKPALDYIYAGKAYGGSYQLSNPAGYPNFRGLMTWSINWDVASNLSWSTPYRSYLDALTTGINETPGNDPATPGAFALEQNYPNPFNPGTTIKYTVGVAGEAGAGNQGSGVREAGAGGRGLGIIVKLAVYDLLGREVAVLVDERKTPGTYDLSFDGSGLASGIYFYRLTVGSYVQSKKMTLIR